MQLKIVSSDAELHTHHKAVELELVAVELGTFDVRFVGNAEIFFVGLVVDAETARLSHSLAEESCRSSYFVVKNMLLAFAWDPEGTQSCVVDS